MTTRTSTRLTGLALVLVLVAASAGCGKVAREGRASSYLIIQRMTGASGADPSSDSDELSSDVVTNGSVFEDLGTAQFVLALKDIGQGGTPAAPSTNNYVTVSRYRVSYRRADGRNTPGVDVPYGFDGGATVTVGDQSTELSFVLVRVQAKEEAPLKNLRQGGGAAAISTIADVTFYGRDQAGNDVSVTGSISVNFADWADPTTGN